MAVSKPSFPHTKFREDFGKDVGGGDFAGDGAEGVEAAAQVGGGQVGRKAVRKAAARIGQRFRSRVQRFVMTGVRDDGLPVLKLVGIDARYQILSDGIDVTVVFGGYPDDRPGEEIAA